MPADAVVTEITETDIAPVAAFLARQVRAGEPVSAHALAPERSLRWLLLENPARASDIPLGWCIRDASSAIVGAAICSPFVIGTTSVSCTALMFSKFFVDLPHRGMGLGLLMRFVREGARFPLFVTSTNAVAGELFKRVGALQIGGMDHTMLGIVRTRPLAEEFFHRKTRLRVLAQVASAPALFIPSRISRSRKHESIGSLSSVKNPDELKLPPPTDRVAVVRSPRYLQWRYFAGELDKEVYRFQFPDEPDRLVVANLLGTGYRAQIRVLNVLDVWPPSTWRSAPAIAAHLASRYRGKFDTIWLCSQPASAEESLQRSGFVRHAFPAPLGWFIDRDNRLAGRDWYIMPGESE